MVDARALGATVTSVIDAGVLAPGTLLGNRYRIIALLGVGGMGMVYRALDETLELEVALKLIRPERAADHELRDRLREELLSARKVSHPNVIRIHDIGQDGTMIFLSMDFVDGRSLRQILQQDGPLSPPAAVAIGRQLAAGLAAAHDAGIIHRDLKPANVLVDAEGRAYISDFGIARSLQSQGLTRTGTIIGTPDYLSPEQAQGGRVDHRSDIYALGIMLYEMVAGGLPFVSETFAELLAQRISGQPRTVAEAGVTVPPHLEAIIARCLAGDVADRYADAHELAADLATDLATDSATGAATGSAVDVVAEPTGGHRSFHGKRVALIAALVLSALVIGAGSWLAVRRATPTASDTSTARPVEAVQAIALLPLADRTGRQDLAWLATGVPEMVAIDLGESAAVRVVDSLRVERTLQDLKLDPSAGLSANDLALLGELLDVDRLATGRVQAVGEAIRIELSLVSVARPDAPADRFEAEAAGAEDAFQAIEHLGGAIRQRLELPTPAAAPTARSAAGLAAFADGTRLADGGDLVAARAAFEQAVATDPTFARAWLSLAEVHGNLGSPDRGLEAASRGLALLPAGTSRLRLEGEALEATLAGQPERARQVRETLAERFPHDAEIRLELACGWAEEGRYDEAMPILQAIVAAEPNHPRAWYLLGRYSILQGDNQRAIDDYLVRALVIQNRLGNDQGRADVLNALGVAAERTGALDQARDYYHQAGTLRRSSGDLRGYAATLANLANILALEGLFDEAVTQLDEAIQLREEIGDRTGLANLENQLGTIEERRGRYRPALDRFRRALRLRTELGELRSIAESAYNVGYAYYLLGEYDNAAVYQQQALATYRQAGNPEGAVFASQSLAQLDVARGAWPAALSGFLAALEASRELDLPEAEAVSLAGIGQIAHLQGRFAAALSSFDESAALFADADNTRGVIEVGLLRTATWLDIGAFEQADDALAEVSEQLSGGDNHEQRAALQRLLGLLLLSRGDVDQAQVEVERATEEAAASGDLAVSLGADLARARARLAAGNTGQALAILEPAAERIDQLGHLSLRFEAGALETAIRQQRNELEAAENAARRTLALARRHQPFHGTYRLLLALAEIRRQRGALAEADGLFSAAAGEVERLGTALEAADRASFERLEAVQRILGRTTIDGTADG